MSQKLTAICVVDETGRRVWCGQCATDPERIERTVRGHAGEDAKVGVETGPMTPWFVHELRGRGLDVACLDPRHAGAALKMQMNKTDQNDAESLAQIMRTEPRAESRDQTPQRCARSRRPPALAASPGR